MANNSNPSPNTTNGTSAVVRNGQSTRRQGVWWILTIQHHLFTPWLPPSCDFILNSNHKDAVRKTRDDRRLAVFYCKQQTYEATLQNKLQKSF